MAQARRRATKISRPGRWTDRKRAQFLAELAATANVAASARAVGMSDRSAYAQRQASDEFRAKWAEALAEGYARLEMMLLERASTGTVKPVFYGGKEIGRITEYPDRLAITLLNAHRAAVQGNAASEGPIEDADMVRARMKERLADMHSKLAGDDRGA